MNQTICIILTDPITLHYFDMYPTQFELLFRSLNSENTALGRMNHFDKSLRHFLTYLSLHASHLNRGVVMVFEMLQWIDLNTYCNIREFQ